MSVNFNPHNNITSNDTSTVGKSTPQPYYLTKQQTSFAPKEKTSAKLGDYKNYAKKAINVIRDLIHKFSRRAAIEKPMIPQNTDYTSLLDELSKKNEIEQETQAESPKTLKELLEECKEAGFTDEGIADLKNKTAKYGTKIAEDSVAIAKELNKLEEDGIVVTYRHLTKAIEKVRPDAFASTERILNQIITDYWKHGSQIQEDFYSQLPPELANEMKSWHKNKNVI